MNHMTRAKPPFARRNNSPSEIARTIGTRIVSGTYKPGDKLAGELESSESFGVSRAAFREAMRILSSKGMIESRTKRGTSVTDRKQWHLLDPDVIAWFFDNGAPDESYLRSFFEMRMIVEPAAAGMAAARRSPDQLRIMRQAVSTMEACTLASLEGREADRTFHHTVLEATCNELMLNLSSGIEAAIHWTTVFKYRDRELPRDPVHDHKQVLDAIASKNVNAARTAMSRLVEMALRDTQMMR